jgi:DNA polymerase epsilon subunit 3
MIQLQRESLLVAVADDRAHDQAIARSGKTVTAADVMKAISDLDFGPADNLLPVLEQELAGELYSGSSPYPLIQMLSVLRPAYRNLQQSAKAAKAKPPGPGRGRGPRKSNVAESDREQIDNADEDRADEGEEDEEGE